MMYHFRPNYAELHRMNEHIMGRGYLKDRDYYKRRDQELAEAERLRKPADCGIQQSGRGGE